MTKKLLPLALALLSVSTLVGCTSQKEAPPPVVVQSSATAIDPAKARTKAETDLMLNKQYRTLNETDLQKMGFVRTDRTINVGDLARVAGIDTANLAIKLYWRAAAGDTVLREWVLPGLAGSPSTLSAWTTTGNAVDWFEGASLRLKRATEPVTREFFCALPIFKSGQDDAHLAVDVVTLVTQLAEGLRTLPNPGDYGFVDLRDFTGKPKPMRFFCANVATHTS